MSDYTAHLRFEKFKQNNPGYFKEKAAEYRLNKKKEKIKAEYEKLFKEGIE